MIATHGAALSFIPFIRPGRAVIEIGYQKFGPGRGMPFPLSFYYAVAVSVGVKYYFSIGDGAYIGQTKLDVDDVVQLATWAVSAHIVVVLYCVVLCCVVLCCVVLCCTNIGTMLCCTHIVPEPIPPHPISPCLIPHPSYLTLALGG